MGWLGWTEEQAMATDMQSIEIAYQGRHEMLCAMAGRDIAHAKIDDNAMPTRAMTPELFSALFGGKK